mmetsp:Transcript_18104/g.51595  ORF Transcript_18104/g.51595 Transcript_18104/m.51595 type:complete len:319 (+) Transcript_18104:250-1206(+)
MHNEQRILLLGLEVPADICLQQVVHLDPCLAHGEACLDQLRPKGLHTAAVLPSVGEEADAAVWQRAAQHTRDQLGSCALVDDLGRDDRGESLGRQHLAHLRAGGRGPVEREHAATVPDAVLVDVGLELLEEHRLAITQNHSAPQLRQRDAHESDAGAELQHRPGAQAGLVPAAAGAAAKRGEPTHQQQGTGPDAAAGQQAAIQVVGAGRPAAAPHANLQRRDPGVTDEPDLVSRCAPRPILLTVCCPVYARDVPLLLPNVTIDLDFGQALLQLPLDVLQRRRRLLVGRAATEDEGEFRAYQQLVASHLGPQHEVVEDR